MICIYKIVNSENSKSYVGSTKNFSKRKQSHLRGLETGKHHNSHLQRAYDMYGKDIFCFEILEQCEKNELFDKELKWITEINPEYNIGGVGGGDNYTNNPNKKEMYKRLVNQLKQCVRPKLFKGTNGNWKGGTTFFKCSICGIEKRVNVVPKTCSKCRNRKGDKNSFYGKKHSEKTKQLIRLNKQKDIDKQSIPCIIFGVKYYSIKNASECMEIAASTIRYRVKSNNIKFVDWIVDNEEIERKQNDKSHNPLPIKNPGTMYGEETKS